MKVLRAAEMRAIDQRTMESGIPALVLMENAGCRVVEFLAARFAPLERQRIVIVCGKGNNGGDGLVVARQLFTRFRPAALDVILALGAEGLSPDAAANLRMLEAAGCAWHTAIEPRMRAASLVIDALLGTGLRGPAAGPALDWIREMNGGFPAAVRLSVDIPSGLCESGESVAAAHTVTFTAPKREQVLPPTCDRVGELHVVPIGTPHAMLADDPSLWLSLTTASPLRPLMAPRARGAHKGDFGRLLVVGGAAGKGGAAAMAGLAALRIGAGLVTVATAPAERNTVTAMAPELMTQAWQDSHAAMDVLAIGPGLGADDASAALARDLFASAPQPLVADADALNALAGTGFHGAGRFRVLTPHPGEMARLAGVSTAEVQASRLELARRYAGERECVVVLKGQRTLIAFPGGRVSINPTGTPAMAKAGSGDILTGLIAGLLAQAPEQRELAVLAAVWLHGRAGELAAAAAAEQCVLATDLLRFLPQAIHDLDCLPDRF